MVISQRCYWCVSILVKLQRSWWCQMGFYIIILLCHEYQFISVPLPRHPHTYKYSILFGCSCFNCTKDKLLRSRLHVHTPCMCQYSLLVGINDILHATIIGWLFSFLSHHNMGAKCLI